MKTFEKLIIQEIVSSAGLADLALDKKDVNVSVVFTGFGYFLSFSDASLPNHRVVLDRPNIFGKLGEIDVGYVGFIENSELTLECYTYGDALGSSNRESVFIRK